MAAPCHPHSSAISELMKRAKSVISRPSFQPPTAFSGERDQPGSIAAVAPLGRCVPATRARPSGRSTGGPPGHGRPPWSPSQAGLTDRRPKRDATAHRYCETLR